MELTNQPNRTLYFDILRILATFAVIFLHSACASWDMDNFSFDWNVRNIYDSAVRWCVPVFVMISGALFLNPEKHISIKKLYTKNIVRIITAFFLWGTIYAAYNFFINNDHNLIGFVLNILYGQFHFWFLYMIIGVYITIPILRQIAQNKTATKYFLIMAFVFTFILPLSLSIISKLLPTIISNGGSIISLLYHYFESLDLALFAGYSGYFLLGYYLNANKCKYTNLIYTIGILSFIAIGGGTVLSFYIFGEFKDFLYKYLTPFVLFEAIAVFLFIKNHTPKIKFSAKAISLITKISNLCFGIYLVHILVLWLLSHYGISTNKFSTIISIPTISILVFAISLFISSCLYKIPFCRKYMM